MDNPIITETAIIKKVSKRIEPIEWLLRIGIFGTFIGHGLLAYGVKTSWITYLTTVGFSKTTACFLMPLIGISDICIAFLALIKPVRILLIWASIWTLSTAIIRPVSGELLLNFVERAANWTVPLALLLVQGFPSSWKGLWSVK